MGGGVEVDVEGPSNVSSSSGTAGAWTGGGSALIIICQPDRQ